MSLKTEKALRAQTARNDSVSSDLISQTPILLEPKHLVSVELLQSRIHASCD